MCTENALWILGFTIIRQAPVHAHTHTHTHTTRQGITRSQEKDRGEIFLLHLQREHSPANTLVSDFSLQNCENILSVFYAPQPVVLCYNCAGKLTPWMRMGVWFGICLMWLVYRKTMAVGKAWRRRWHPTAALLPGKSHGRRSLVGCSPWGR